MPQAKPATFAGGDREILPTLTLYQSVLFPGMRCRVELATVRAYGAVVEATRSLGEKAVAVFAARGALPRDPGLDQLFEVGSVARVLSLQRLPCCHRFIAELEAVARIRSDAHLREQPFRLASVRRLPEPEQDRVLVESLTRAVQDGARRIASRSPHCMNARRALWRLQQIADPIKIPGVAMDLFPDLSLPEQQRALELNSLVERLDFVLTQMGSRASDSN